MDAPALLGIDTVTVSASNVARSVAFFRDALGLLVRRQEPGWAELDASGVTLAISGGGTAEAAAKTLAAQPVQVSFRVENRDAAVAALRARGVPFSGVADQPYGKMATFKDPDGNRFQLYEPGQNRSDEGRTAENAALTPGTTLAELDREDIGTG